jgi:hypothetical protein
MPKVLQGKVNAYAETNHADALMVLSACFHGGSVTSITDDNRLSAQLFSPELACARRRSNILFNDIEEIKGCGIDFESGLGMALADFFSVGPFIESGACFASGRRKISGFWVKLSSLAICTKYHEDGCGENRKKGCYKNEKNKKQEKPTSSKNLARQSNHIPV